MVHDLFELDAFETMADVLLDHPVRIVLDVGAHAGSSCDRLLAVFPDSSVVAFEPVTATFMKLHRRYGEHPRVRAVQAAVGDGSGEIEILVNGLSDTSSALAPTEMIERFHGDKVREVSRERVPLIRLDDWCARRDTGPVDAMKIDVQGLELDVLRGAERMLRRSVRAVISEAQIVPIYEGAAVFAEIDLFLRDCGFVLHQISRIASCGAERRTTCCDAIWVRQDVHQDYVARLSGLSLAETGAHR